MYIEYKQLHCAYIKKEGIAVFYKGTMIGVMDIYDGCEIRKQMSSIKRRICKGEISLPLKKAITNI